MKEVICQICKHSVDEHGKDGCYHIEYKKDATGKETDILTSCNCEVIPTQIYQQKGNQ